MRNNNSSNRKVNKPKMSQYTVKEPMELLPFLLKASKFGRNSAKALLARGQVSVDDQV